MESSYHGINNFFGLRLQRTKLCWLIISSLFFGLFIYYSILSFDTYIIKRPIRTDLHYKNHEQIQMPEVLICPTLPNQTAFESFFPGTVGPMFSFLGSLSEHPIFSGIRDVIRKNVSAGFERYPHLEEEWGKLYTTANLDPIMASFYGLLFF